MNLPDGQGLGREQLTASFESAYQQAPYFMVMLDCKGSALDAFQSNLESDGWSVVGTAPQKAAPEAGSEIVLKTAEPKGDDTQVIWSDAVELAKLFDGSLNPECQLSDQEINALAIKHRVLQAVSYYFPVNLLEKDASRKQKIAAINSFYGEAYENLPEDDPRIVLSDRKPVRDFVGRFSHGFALMGLLDSLNQADERKITENAARGGLARIIENSRVHRDSGIRTMGNPLTPEIIKSIISEYSRRHNQKHN